MATYTLTSSENDALTEVSNKLNVNKNWLFALISFESGWDPLIKNPQVGQSARGLIQFVDSTARGMGYNNSLDLVNKNPTIEGQLRGPVYLYLKPYSPYPTVQSLYMGVFYPKARKWPIDKAFPANVQAKNKPIKTVRDYVNFVERRNPILKVNNDGQKKSPLIKIASAIAVGAGLYYFS
jgi:hypothetical protein